MSSIPDRPADAAPASDAEPIEAFDEFTAYPAFEPGAATEPASMAAAADIEPPRQPSVEATATAKPADTAFAFSPEPAAPPPTHAMAPFVSLGRDDFVTNRPKGKNGADAPIFDREGNPVSARSRPASEAAAGPGGPASAASPPRKPAAANPSRAARLAAGMAGVPVWKIPPHVRRHALEAATLAVTLGVGWLVGANTFDNSREVDRLTQQASALDAKFAGLSARPAATRPSVAEFDVLRREIERLQANAKIARTTNDANRTAMSGALDGLKTRLDQIADLQQAAAGREAQLVGRMDRMEKELSADLPTGTIAAVAAAPKSDPVTATPKSEPVAAAPKTDPVATASKSALPAQSKLTAANLPTPELPLPPVHIPAAPTQPARPSDVSAPPVDAAATDEARAHIPADGYVLRDVIDGSAVVESRAGLRAVKEGDMLPGAGRVEAIERRGHKWIVVTSDGIIDDATY